MSRATQIAYSVGEQYRAVLFEIADQIPDTAHEHFLTIFPQHPTNPQRLLALIEAILGEQELGLEFTEIESIGHQLVNRGKTNQELPSFPELLYAVGLKLEYLLKNGHNDIAFADDFMINWIEVEIEQKRITRQEVQDIYNYYNSQKMLNYWQGLTQDERVALIAKSLAGRKYLFDTSDPELKVKVENWLNEGMLFSDIARTLKTTGATVIAYVGRAGINYNRELYGAAQRQRWSEASASKGWKPTDEEHSFILSSLESRLSIKYIAERLDISDQILRRYLDIIGIAPPRTALYKQRVAFFQSDLWAEYWQKMLDGSSLAEVYELAKAPLQNVTFSRFTQLIKDWLEENGTTHLWAKVTKTPQEIGAEKRLLSDDELPGILGLLKLGHSVPQIQKMRSMQTRSPIDNLLQRNGYDWDAVRRLNPVNKFRDDVFPTDQFPRIERGEISQAKAAVEISQILSAQEGREIRLTQSSIANWVAELRQES